MIECVTPINFHTKRTFDGKTKKTATILIIVGLVGVCIGFALMIGLQAIWPAIFLVFAIPLALGIFLLKKMLKVVNEVLERNLVNKYVFDQDTFAVSVFENGERVGQSIIGYNELVDVREDSMFIYMFLNPQSGMPVSKNAMSQQDLQQLRIWLKLDQQ